MGYSSFRQTLALGLFGALASAGGALAQDGFAVLMTEADYIERLQDYLQTYLEGLAVSFTVISAYIVALHYFLRAAPFVVRCFAFLFLTSTLAALGLHLYSAYRFFLVLTDGLGRLAAGQPGGTTAQQVFDLTQIATTNILIWGVWIIGVGSYLALLLMTFVFDWRATSSQRPAR